jgi:hypothetical protein
MGKEADSAFISGPTIEPEQVSILLRAALKASMAGLAEEGGDF